MYPSRKVTATRDVLVRRRASHLVSLTVGVMLSVCLAWLQMASQVRVQHKLPVTYIALDWHQMDKELGSDKLVEAFWTQLSAVIPQQVWGALLWSHS
jgi:hypothetical protein